MIRVSAIERILVVGIGSIGRRHLRIARLLNPSAQILAFRQSEGGEIPEYADGCITQIGAALAFAPQIAVISNPATQHVAIARSFAEIGSHLLIEKPLAESSIGVASLLDICRRSGSIVMTGYNLRFLPSLRYLRTLLSERSIGRVLSVRAEVGQYLPSWRPNADYRASVSARRELGGGVLLELSHEIDYLRWLFGDFRWIQATLRQQSSLEIDVEDTAHLILGLLPSPNHDELVVSLNIDFIRRDPVRQCTVIGEDGTLRWNALSGTVDLYGSGDTCWRTVFHHQDDRDYSYLAEWKHLLACVSGDASPLVTGEDGLAVLRVVEAARESSEARRTIMLESENLWVL